MVTIDSTPPAPPVATSDGTTVVGTTEPFAVRLLPITERAELIGYIVFGGVLVRFLAETVVSSQYPRRLQAADCGVPDGVSKPQQVVSLAVRAFTTASIALSFSPLHPQVAYGIAAVLFITVASWWHRFAGVPLVAVLVVLQMGQPRGGRHSIRRHARRRMRGRSHCDRLPASILRAPPGDAPTLG